MIKVRIKIHGFLLTEEAFLWFDDGGKKQTITLKLFFPIKYLSLFVAFTELYFKLFYCSMIVKIMLTISYILYNLSKLVNNSIQLKHVAFKKLSLLQ